VAGHAVEQAVATALTGALAVPAVRRRLTR
jgi:hypothetical protein